MAKDKEDKAPSLRSRYGNLSVSKKVLTALLAVAAALTSLWGAFQAVEGALGIWRERRDVQTELFRTPRLGFEFWHEGARNDMFFDSEADKEIVSVSMTSEPFEIRFPKLEEGQSSPTVSNVGLQINAWSDDSNFHVREGTRIGDFDVENPEDVRGMASPFNVYKAAADYQFGSGRLYLTEDSHMYFTGTRIASHSSSQDKAFFTTVYRDGKDYPLAEQKDDIFLTVVFDRDVDDVIEFGEYEYIVLNF